ncbi:MAG: PilN domain-containing protein [Planctomycetota bacterium]|jgi:hypothetical protein
MIGVNLIPRDRLRKKYRKAHLRTWIVLCAAYALILGAALGAFYVLWGNHNAEELKGKREATENQIEDSKLTINKLREDLSDTRFALEASKAMGNQPDWSTLLCLLAHQLGDDIVLEGCELSPLEAGDAGTDISTILANLSNKDVPLGQRRYRVKLSGFGRTQTAVSQFVLRLERIEFFDEVKTIRSNRQSFRTAKAVAFQVECSI